MVNKYEWMREMNVMRLVGDIGKKFGVKLMVGKDMVR